MSERLIGENIGKKYGKKVVLEQVNLELEHGKIYGLIGRNGAGKTTLLSILSAQNPATEGRILLDGTEVWENSDALSHICFARELAVMKDSMLGSLRVKDFLKCAGIYYPHWDKNYAEELLLEFELDEKQKLAKLSKGMQSMVMIIIALASKSEFTFMDEPAAGLDIIARERLYQLIIEEYMETKRTFVISTHILEEAADVFEEVIFLKEGKLLLKENTQELLERTYHVSGVREYVEDAVKNLEIHQCEKSERSMSAVVLLRPGQILKGTSEITVQPLSLPKIFTALCGKEA